MDNYRERIHQLLSKMLDAHASDLHLCVGVSPHMRIHGTIVKCDLPALIREDCEGMLFSLLTNEEKTLYNQTKNLDFSFGEPGIGRFRVNIYQQRGTIAAAIRLLPMEIMPLETIGLPTTPIKRFCNLSNGLVLVCGPVGSGKTTTLASIIDYINKIRACHIMSIEDPIEYVHKNIKSLIHQREVRRDTPDFTNALKYVLREDPDIVVIGEMRDLDTMVSALTIAETGHLVFATLHTGDTIEAIHRIVDSFPASEQSQVIAQLSFTLLGVVNQLLLPRCDVPGRVLSAEVMVVTPAIQNLIRENKVEQIYSQLLTGSQYGMQTMNQSLASLVKSKIVKNDVALGETKKVNEFLKLVGGNDYA